jgi:hypothetical protein
MPNPGEGSVKVEGRNLLNKLKAMEAAADPGVKLPEPINTRGTGADAELPGNESREFGARYFEPDQRDDYAYIKGVLADDRRPAPITDQDVQSVLRKAAAYEVAKQEDWFSNSWKFNASDPVKQRWAESVFPEFFARREKVIDQQTLLQNRLAKIKLRGPRSRDDIDLLYAIDMGIVDVHDSSIFNPTPPNYDNARRGLFSPRRVIISNMDARVNSLKNPLSNFPRGGAKALDRSWALNPDDIEYFAGKDGTTRFGGLFP